MRELKQVAIWVMALIGLFFILGGTFEYTNTHGHRILVGHYDITANK